MQKCPDICPGGPDGLGNKAINELRTLLAAENAELKGAINWTIDNVCSAEDRKAIMQLDNYASECYEMTCSLHIMQQDISFYVRHRSIEYIIQCSIIL